MVTENYQHIFCPCRCSYFCGDLAVCKLFTVVSYVQYPTDTVSHSIPQLFPMYSIPQTQLFSSPFIITKQNSSRKKKKSKKANKIKLDQNKLNMHVLFSKNFGILRLVFIPVKMNVFGDVSKVPIITLSYTSSSRCGVYTSRTVALGSAVGTLPRLIFMLKEVGELL